MIYELSALKTVYIANALGLLLLIMLRLGSAWSVYSESFERKTLQRMIWVTVVCCLCDPLVYTMDGRPGLLPLILDYIGNSWLYLGNLFVGLFWIHLLENHLNVHVDKVHRSFHMGLFAFGVICIIYNMFHPIIFSLENNIYKRQGFYWVFLAIAVIYMIDGLVMYAKTKKTGGVLKTFPVWLFVVPIIFGVAIQSAFYGISAIWPCVAIGLAGIMASVQNEKIVIDTLTGVYNRFYLDYLKDDIISRHGAAITGVMIDVNDFKKINDSFGHSTGDDALIETAKILRAAVGVYGNVTRYAGDEFVLLINSIDETVVKGIIKNIRSGFDRFNASSGKPYELTVAIGYAMLDLSCQSMSEFMNIIDRKMYENKKAYHQSKSDRDTLRIDLPKY